MYAISRGVRVIHKTHYISLHMRELNAKQLGTELSHQELNVKQVCAFAFIVSNKVQIVTIIASDLSGVIILIDIKSLIQGTFLNLYTSL